MKEKEYKDRAQEIEDGEDRALSEYLREANADLPVKDGVSLHDAVMRRVRDGDTAPRYLPTRSFRFPVATAACLVLCLVAVFVTKSGLMSRFDKKSADSGAPEEAYLLESDAEAQADEKESGGAFLSGASFGAMPSGTDNALAEEETEKPEESEDPVTVKDAVITENAAIAGGPDAGGTMKKAKAAAQTDADAQNGAILQESKLAAGGTAYAPDTPDADVADTPIISDAAVCDGVPLAEGNEVATEETVEESVEQNDAGGASGASAGGSSSRYATRGAGGGSSAAKGTSGALSNGVAERMQTAAAILSEHGAENLEPIRPETIASCGEDVYCAFFDAIASRTDFAALYTEAVFFAYCEKGEEAFSDAG